MKTLIPDESMHFQKISSDEVFEGTIYIPDNLSIDDFRQITDEEYQKIIGEGGEVTQQEYNELIDRIEGVEKLSNENSEQITETQMALCELYEQVIM
ncbi:MAG: hypothetical protein UH239_07840 [Acutalibacteraceae bacterium]|nr:hypothetical protein [Acutalibacteraceae bacterium]